MIFPFLPASNLLVYPGTTVGEVCARVLCVRKKQNNIFFSQRLLYTPSIGFIYLVVLLFVRPALYILVCFCFIVLGF